MVMNLFSDEQLTQIKLKLGTMHLEDKTDAVIAAALGRASVKEVLDLVEAAWQKGYQMGGLWQPQRKEELKDGEKEH